MWTGQKMLLNRLKSLMSMIKKTPNTKEDLNISPRPHDGTSTFVRSLKWTILNLEKFVILMVSPSYQMGSVFYAIIQLSDTLNPL